MCLLCVVCNVFVLCLLFVVRCCVWMFGVRCALFAAYLCACCCVLSAGAASCVLRVVCRL